MASLGSSNILTDRQGNRVDHYGYFAFGKERYNEPTPAFPISHRYTGQIFDEATGLYYYNARYYDPELGRFVQADDEVPDPSDPQTFNRYTYVGNNPLLYADPTGNFPIIAAIIIGAAIGGATAAATGGNIWQGIVTGAIGGLFGGLGALAGKGFLASTFGKFWGGFVGAVAGGAAGGATSAAIFGGDVGLAAASGAVGAAIGYGFGQLAVLDPDTIWDDIWNYAVSSAGGALGGGIGAVIQGGDFGQGAAYGAIGAAIGYTIAVDIPDAIRDHIQGTERLHFPVGGLVALGVKAWTAFRAWRAAAVAAAALSKLKIDPAQLAGKFKHAKDFGIEGHKTAVNLAKYAEAIRAHVGSPANQIIQGTFRGQPATFYVDPTTRLTVITDRAGNFISAWRLSPKQFYHVTTSGRLGGGP